MKKIVKFEFSIYAASRPRNGDDMPISSVTWRKRGRQLHTYLSIKIQTLSRCSLKRGHGNSYGTEALRGSLTSDPVYCVALRHRRQRTTFDVNEPLRRVASTVLKYSLY